jgi:DNA-binding winged helix-turn-helix (wHTH) protein/tetratricopeptide (TPR) repeat protein
MAYKFEDFELDPEALELRGRGEPVALQELPLRLLVALVEKAGRLVERQDLQNLLWPDVAFQDFDNSLNSAVNRLRQALGDSVSDPRFIVTVPRRGYKFIAPVEELPRPASPRPRTVEIARRWNRGAVAILCVVAVAATWILLQTRSGRDSAAGPAEPAVSEVQTHFLRGLHFADRRSREGIERAIAEFQAAIATDPGHAPSYGRLGIAYAMLGWYDYWPPRDAVPPATEMAAKALDLDPESPEGHLAMSIIQAFEWAWPEAKRHGAKAVELAPKLADARAWMGTLLAMTGELESGVVELETACEMAPSSAPLRAGLCWHLFNAGRFDAAVETCHRALELEPALLDAHDNLKWIYTTLGDEAEASRQFARVVDLEGGDSQAVWRIFERAGLEGLLRDSLETLLRRERQGYQSPFDIALEYAALSEQEQALSWLERSLAERETDLASLTIDIRFESLRGDPRFQRIVDSVGAPGTARDVPLSD